MLENNSILQSRVNESKGKLFLCMHEGIHGSRGIAPLILNFGMHSIGDSSSHSDGLHNFGVEKNLLSLLRIEPQLHGIQPPKAIHWQVP
jgi:hypothetical protein